MDEPLGHEIPVQPAGEYAPIDIAGQNAALAALHGPDPGPAVATYDHAGSTGTAWASPPVRPR